MKPLDLTRPPEKAKKSQQSGRESNISSASSGITTAAPPENLIVRADIAQRMLLSNPYNARDAMCRAGAG